MMAVAPTPLILPALILSLTKGLLGAGELLVLPAFLLGAGELLVLPAFLLGAGL